MKLQMRWKNRSSREEMEKNFSPINLDYIFHEGDPLAPWLEEREEGAENAEWLPILDSDDEEAEIIADNESSGEKSNHNSDSLSNKSGGVGENIRLSESVKEEEQQKDTSRNPVQEEQSLLEMFGEWCRGKMSQQQDALDDSASSSVAQSFSDYDSSQGFYPHPQYYPNPSYVPYQDSSQGFYQNPPTYMPPHPPTYMPPHPQTFMPSHPPIYMPAYQDSSQGFYQNPPAYVPPQYPLDQYSSGLAGYFFGRGEGHGENQGEESSFDPSRHSTMW